MILFQFLIILIINIYLFFNQSIRCTVEKVLIVFGTNLISF